MTTPPPSAVPLRGARDDDPWFARVAFLVLEDWHVLGRLLVLLGVVVGLGWLWVAVAPLVAAAAGSLPLVGIGSFKAWRAWSSARQQRRPLSGSKRRR